jgi:hypothetical protein
MEIDPFLDDDGAAANTGEVEVMAISLAAIAGMQPRSGNTLRLIVTIGGKNWVALLDSGSTHNFLAHHVVEATDAQLCPRPGTHATVANGDRINIMGVCRELAVTIEGNTFIMDCYAIPLEGFDIILGVQWLSTLGPAIWDFAKLTMSFFKDDRRVTWHGLPRSSRPAHTHACATIDVLNELLDDFSDVFAKPHGYHWNENTAITFVSFQAQNQWLCAHTGTPNCRKMSWSGNATRCFAKGQSERATLLSPRRCCSLGRKMGHGASALTIAPSTIKPSRISSPSRWWTNSWMSSMAPNSSPSWTCARGTIKC